MRYALLVLFGAVGVLLLVLAHNRYDVANRQLAGLNTVDGIVSSMAENGDLNVKYRVGSTDYEVVRSLPVNFFPRIRAGERIALVYAAARPDTATVRHWSKVYQDVAVSGGFGLVAIAMAIAAMMAMASAPTTPQTRPLTPPTAAVSLDHPMELRNTRKDFVTSLLVVAGTFVAAFLLWRNPYFLGTPWLSYPAAVAVVLLAAGMLWGSFQNRSLRIRADQFGIEIQDNEGSRHFVWTDVAAIKRETVTKRMQHVSAIKHGSNRDYTYTTHEVQHNLIVEDKTGKALLKLDEDTPMDPLQDWLLLRAYIPQRTGLPVTEVSRESALGDGVGL